MTLFNHLGNVVIRKYCLPDGNFTVCTPCGNRSATSSGATVGCTMHGWPRCQSAGVATRWRSVSCSASMTRRISLYKSRTKNDIRA